MIRGGIPIGKAFGIQLRLHYSWFLIFALVTGLLAGVYFPSTYPNWSLALKIGAGLVTSVLFFASVLVHELCHSIVALREGMRIQSITLFFLGGVSQMTGEPRTAGDEFRMAGAGPASSLVLGGLFIGIFFALGGNSTSTPLPFQFGAAVAFYLGYINVLLGIFNLIPGFPLDGGRVLRSIIWAITKKLQVATRIASGIGRAIGWIFILGGVFFIFGGGFYVMGSFFGGFVNGIWFVLIGWFLESAAAGSYRQLLMEDMLKGHIASEIMTSDCTIVQPDMTVEALVNENIMTSGRRCFPVASSMTGQAEGLMTLNNVKEIPRNAWHTTQIRQAMIPMEKVRAVSPNDDLNKVLQIMTEFDINQVPVVWENKIIGIIGRDNLITFINTRAELKRR